MDTFSSFFFFSELVSARPLYIANEIRGPQSARNNGTDLYKTKRSFKLTKGFCKQTLRSGCFWQGFAKKGSINTKT